MGQPAGFADRVLMRIRPIEDGDVAGVIALWRACDLLRPWNDPKADIARARAAPQTEIFVVGAESAIVASAMAGCDGHRGWLYYVATDPGRRGEGLGKAIMAHAEAWLKAQGVAKINLMIRGGNPATGFYEAAGYEIEARSVLAKWLVDPPRTDEPRQRDVTVTYLEMRDAPLRPPPPQPRVSGKLALMRAHKPTVAFYRFLYNSVGAAWRWWERNRLSDEDLAVIIHNEQVEIYVLYIDGAPAGYVELDYRDRPDVELAYFGLMAEYIGLGLGAWLLDWAVQTALSRQPDRLWVHTCTLDHPAALAVYQKAGFTPYRQEIVHLPADIDDQDRPYGH